jgi:hypothetical protein
VRSPRSYGRSSSLSTLSDRATCIGEASLVAEGLIGPAPAEWLDRVPDDLENYRAATSWLIERGRPAEASDVSGLFNTSNEVKARRENHTDASRTGVPDASAR